MRVPTIKILVPRPFHNPLKPILEYISLLVYPVLFIIETIVSAGWETIAQNIPAEYPEQKVTKSYVGLLYSFFGFLNTFLYAIWTNFSNATNFTIV